MNKLVSVIIPCYNSSGTIIETLKSVISQTYKNIEIIIVNDGSNDNSEQVVLEFINSNDLQNIKLINQINSGPSKARNKGVSFSSGEYILFLDSDDLIEETYIYKCVKVLDSNSEVKIVYSDASFFGFINSKWNLREFSFPDFLMYNCIFITALIRKKEFLDVGGFDERLSFTEDWDLWLSFVDKYGENIVHKINETLFYYRKHEDKSSLTDNKTDSNNEELSRLLIYNKHFGLYQKYNMDLMNLFLNVELKKKIEKKYYSIWYKKIFYLFKKNIKTLIHFNK